MKTMRVVSKESGAVLLVALILLVVLTLLGLSAMDTVMLEIRLATNAQEKSYAFAMAETILRENDDEIFSEALFIGGVTEQNDREVRANEAAWLDRNMDGSPDDEDGDGHYDHEFQGTVPRQHGLESSAYDDKTIISYKGSFKVPAGAPGGDWDANAAAGAYFEVLTQGRNTSIAGEAGEILMTLRAGYRQLAPVEENITYENAHND